MLAGEVERDHEEQRSGPPVDRVKRERLMIPYEIAD
jgi:hypothetical protein